MKLSLKAFFVYFALYVAIEVIWYWYEVVVYGRAFPNDRDSIIAAILAMILSQVVLHWHDRGKKEEK